MRGSVAFALLAFAALTASCGGSPPPGAPLSLGASSKVIGSCARQTPPAKAAAAKAPITGLVDLGQVSVVNMPEPPLNTLYYVCQRSNQISGIVVNDTWASLQPQAGGSLHTAPIDAALRAVRQYDAANSRHLRVRLRIWGGYDAPAWAKAIGGAPVVICNQYALPTPGASPLRPAVQQTTPTPCPAAAQRTVGRFWSHAYGVAWRALQRKLGKHYHTRGGIDEVAVSSCSSLSAEPFVQSEDAYSVASLRAAGYTDAAYERCLSTAVRSDYAPFWKETALDYSVNPMRLIDTRPPSTDLAFTKSVIDGCRSAVGSRCVLFNQTMGKFTPPPSPEPGQTPSVAQSYFRMWSYMRQKGGPIGFQTASPPNLLLAWGTNRAGWQAAIALAHRFGASSVELFPPKARGPCTTSMRLWVAGYTCFSAQQLGAWKRLLDAKS